MKSGSDPMKGMEHPKDTLFVPPILNERVMSIFCKAVQSYADTHGSGKEVSTKLLQIQTQLQQLVDLAGLCRFAILGEPRSISRILDEMQCIVVDFPDATLASQPMMDMNVPSESNSRTQLAAAVDLFAGAAFASAGNQNQLKRFIVALVSAIEKAVAFPLVFESEAATYIGEGDGTISPLHAAMAIANATQRLLDNDINCTPMAPDWFRQWLQGLANRWIQKNPVSTLLDTLSDSLQDVSISPTVAKVGDTVTLQLKGDEIDDHTELIVMFCPHYSAKIRSSRNHSIQVEVPDRAQSGPVIVLRKPKQQTLIDISSLEKKFENDYNTEWSLSAFGTVPLSKWSYPVAFWNVQKLEVVQVPHSVTVAIFDSSGRRAERKKLDVGEEVKLRYRVEPLGSDANVKFEMKATGGTIIKDAEPNTLRYSPTEEGMGSIDLTWGSYTRTVSIEAIREWSLLPNHLLLKPDGPTGSFQLWVNTPVDKDLTFTLESTTGHAVVKELVVLPRGSQSVTVSVAPKEKILRQHVNRISDVIKITYGKKKQDFHVWWCTQPHGLWDNPINNALNIVGVHAVVLYTGKILYFCFDVRAVNNLNTDNFKKYFNDPNLGSYQIWDPITQTAGPVQPIGRNIFCAGQCQLADGTIFTAGGQDAAGAADVTQQWDKFFGAILGSDEGAQKDVHTYDPVLDTWVRWPDLNDGRYYPTCQTLGDGSAFIAGGLSNLMQFVMSGSNWAQNDQYEIYDINRGLGPNPPRPFMSADQYPIVRLLPGSRQLFVHIHRTTYLFDLDLGSFVSGAQFIPPSPVGRQTYPMQTGHVLLPQHEGDPPRILIVGGSTHTDFNSINTQSDAPAVPGAFIFEYNQGSPSSSFWRNTIGSPNVARLLCDTVLLPNGTVFVVNGIRKGAASGHSYDTVFDTEIFDPDKETFTKMADSDHNHPRAYHSTAVLLPDGRVAIAGNTAAYNNPGPDGNPPFDDTTIQVFNPPYLFCGPRPTVTGVPTVMTYGTSTTIQYVGDPPIARVMMMRPCAVTHSVDMDQRAIWLSATNQTNGNNNGGSMLTFTMPNDRALAPPGYYMLFFLSDAGVPSIASWVLLGDLVNNSGDNSGGANYPPLYLGTYENGARDNVVYEGDIIVEKIDQYCNISLESKYGSITINQKCDQHCWVHLKAKTAVSIGQKIDQHCTVIIECEGAVYIGQKVDGNSDATITTSTGSIYIGQKIDGSSRATLKASNGTITIVQKVDGNSVVNWHATNLICPDTRNAQVTQF